MGKLTVQNNQLSENKIELTAKQIQLACEIEQLNEIYAPFNLSDDDIVRWVKRISELEPEISLEDLNKVIINFISGNYLFNKNLGIANIFLGYKKLKQQGMVY